MINYLRKKIRPDNPLRLFWHKLKGILAAFRYDFPASKMVVIGITGTNGKTTTTHMTEELLRKAGKKVAMISTVEYRLLGKVRPNTSKMTTMSPFQTQKFLQECKKAGVEYMVIESSSHALHQSRLWGIPFAISVLTNITHEHLDYHGSMEKYKEAKKILFKLVEKNCKRHCTPNPLVPHQHTAVLNVEDQYYSEFNEVACPHKIAYGFNKGNLRAEDVKLTPKNSTFTLKHEGENQPISLKVAGRYNIENALAAAGAAIAAGCSLQQIKQGLEGFKGVPGRMERISSPVGFEVIVDFALTPDALEKLYSTLSEANPNRIIGIIGSAGERDKLKRPKLGEIVARYADIAIVTDEEPYSEDPLEIMEQILKGAQQIKTLGKALRLIEDRYEAIETAIQEARQGDIVVVTGMGNFTTRNINKGAIPWDEREIVREIITKYS